MRPHFVSERDPRCHDILALVENRYVDRRGPAGCNGIAVISQWFRYTYQSGPIWLIDLASPDPGPPLHLYA